MADEPNPYDEGDEPEAADDFRELAIFRRGEVVRTYALRPVEGGAELWRITQAPGTEPQALTETTFRSAEEALAFLEELQRTLRAGGWTAV
jgi:hypothetical protein